MTETASDDSATVRWRRARTFSMIDFLAKRGRKYQRALEGDRLAAFSIVGTQDWEDFADVSFTAMQAESLADIDMRLEALTAAVGHLDRRLLQIVELLESGGSQQCARSQEVDRLVEAALGEDPECKLIPPSFRLRLRLPKWAFESGTVRLSSCG